MITALLWDVDGTLLNFHAAEAAALRSLFEQYRFGELTDDMLHRYSALNASLWKALERNEITKSQVLIGRFETFFSREGLDPSLAGEFNDRYQLALGDTIVYCDNSDQIIESLKGKIPQYVISNGTVAAQTKKLERSGLGKLMDGIFLSEAVGAEKPNAGFFDAVLESIGPVNKEELLIIGDSLSSDILGGNRAGIPVCWYNPSGEASDEKYHIDYEIRNLHQIFELPLRLRT